MNEIIDLIMADLMRMEGFRRFPYQDSLGNLTIGYGRNLEATGGTGIREGEAVIMLANDIDHLTSALRLNIEHFPGYPPQVRRALINMAFQMGVHGLLRFQDMLALLDLDHWEAAAEEALNSRWADQTPDRAATVADWIKDGDKPHEI